MIVHVRENVTQRVFAGLKNGRDPRPTWKTGRLPGQASWMAWFPVLFAPLAAKPPFLRSFLLFLPLL